MPPSSFPHTHALSPPLSSLTLSLPARLYTTMQSGSTALHWAVRHGKMGEVKALLKAGAVVAIKNTHGKTAVDLVSDHKSMHHAVGRQDLRALWQHTGPARWH